MKPTSTFNIKQGLSYPFELISQTQPSSSRPAQHVGILAADYPGLKPRLLIKEGETVKLGQPIVEDRRDGAAKILAPAGGEVTAINRGPRRKLISIIIKIAKNEQTISFAQPTAGDSVESFVEKIDEAGILSSIRRRPFNAVARTSDRPVAIFVNAMNTSPGAFDPICFIESHKEFFELGLQLLAAVFSVPIHLCMSGSEQATKLSNSVEIEQKNCLLHQFNGAHPAGLTGTHVNVLQHIDEKNMVWCLDYNSIISIGYLAKTGTLFTKRWIAMGTINKTVPCIIETRDGASISELINDDKIIQSNNLIAGSLLFGHRVNQINAYLPRHGQQITHVVAACSQYFLGWGQLGANRYSKMKVFLGSFMSHLPQDRDMESNLFGAWRGLVPVEVYDSVMPLNIPITAFLRSLLVGDTEKLQELGVLGLSAEDMSLLTFVCPSKHDYCQLLHDSLLKLEQEG